MAPENLKGGKFPTPLLQRVIRATLLVAIGNPLPLLISALILDHEDRDKETLLRSVGPRQSG
jgi:hypothetical protein